MRKRFLLLAALFAFAGPARASYDYKFTLSSASPTADTSDPTVAAEVLIPDATYAIQCTNATANAVTYIRASRDGSAATANFPYIGNGVIYEVQLFAGENRISALASAGTSACTVSLAKKKKVQ